MNKMTRNSKFSLAIVTGLLAIALLPFAVQAQYDDVYYIPGKDRPTETAPSRQTEQPAAVDQPAAQDQTQQADETDQNNTTGQNDRYHEQGSDSYSQTDGNGNTYITNNNYYGDDDNDYYYASRLRRFHNPYYGFGYYDDIYVNRYWYDYQPASWGLSIYIGSCFPAYGFYSHPGIIYNPYCYYSYSYYNPYWYDPFYSYSPYYANYYNPWYNSWYGNSYWGYNNGYYNGYWDGYYNGLYASNNYYNNNNGGANYYYGHRGSMATNSGSHRGNSYQTVSTGTHNNVSHCDGRVKNPELGGSNSIGNDGATINNPVKTAPGNSHIYTDRNDVGTSPMNPASNAPIRGGSINSNDNPVRNNGDGRINDGRGFPGKEQMNTAPLTPREMPTPPVYNNQPTRGNNGNTQPGRDYNNQNNSPVYNHQAPSRNNYDYNAPVPQQNNEYSAPDRPIRNNGGGRNNYNPYENGNSTPRNYEQPKQLPTPNVLPTPQREERKIMRESRSEPSYSAPREAQIERSSPAPQRSEPTRSFGGGGGGSYSGSRSGGGFSGGGGGRHR